MKLPKGYSIQQERAALSVMSPARESPGRWRVAQGHGWHLATIESMHKSDAVLFARAHANQEPDRPSGSWQWSGCRGVGEDLLGYPYRYWSRDRWGFVLMHTDEHGDEPRCISETTAITFVDECTATDALEAANV